MDNVNTVGTKGTFDPQDAPSRRYTPPMRGEEFEADVTLRTMERVFGVLESGEKIGFGWPRIGVESARDERVFARFRKLRDDLIRLRAMDAKKRRRKVA
jgi:hypothetical protein